MTVTSIPMQPDQHLSTEIISALQEIGHILRGLLADHFSEFHLTEVRYAVLKIVDSMTETGCTQSFLAEKLHQSESSVSTLIERMRSDGLLYRLTSKADRRKRVLMLSEKGRELLHSVNQCHDSRMNALLQGVSLKDRLHLKTLLNHLLHELILMNQQEARPCVDADPHEDRIAA